MFKRPSLTQTPERRMSMGLALRQALEILQMPQLELSAWLQNEIEKNPLLEIENKRLKEPFKGDFLSQISFYESIINQIRDRFSDTADRDKAFELMYELDDRGFLPNCTQDGGILKVLQTFDPPGLFARTTQECLLLQLKARNLQNTLAFSLIEKCYDDLLHRRFGAIRKKLKTDHIRQALLDISRLSLRPASYFKHEPTAAPISIDLEIQKIKGAWILEVKEADLPCIQIQSEYFDLKPEEPEEKHSLRLFKTHAKWIFRSLSRRRKLLLEIGKLLVCKQARFLDQRGPLFPLSTKELAEKLHIHESTLSRALFGKYAATPRGIIPLRALITTDPSSDQAAHMIEKYIAAEDTAHPLTDDELAEALKRKGIIIARRTISKYRRKLKIGSAAQRKTLYIGSI